MTVQAAEDLARRAHDRQMDKVGMPYFETHVRDVHRRVAEAGGDRDQQVAALLHDVLEDTSVTEADLRAQGISEAALALVLRVTKSAHEDSALHLERIRAVIHTPVGDLSFVHCVHAGAVDRPGGRTGPYST
jgi:(p)ppGpp synthase/HD superfamily hydrolase